MTWSTGTGTSSKDLLDKIRADAVTHGWTVDSYVVGLGKAFGLLTLTGQPLDTETVVIDTKTYTFQTVLTNFDGNVFIGATASDSIDNLVAAIILGAGAGTKYATAMTVHPTVVAAADAGDTMLATAKTGGTGGNSIATTETLTNGSWGATTLLNGVDPLEDPDILYMNGPGPSTPNVQVNIRTGADVAAGKYWWEIRGALLYDSGQDFDNQPGISPPSYMLMWNSSIPYWLSVSDRRIVLTTKSSTRYFSLYAGFFLPYATPVEYPYPMYIAGTLGTTPPIYTTTLSTIRSAFDPSQVHAYVREPGGTWIEVENHGAGSGGDDNYLLHNGGTYFMWPYYAGGTNTSTATYLKNLEFRPGPAGPADALIIMPLEILGDAEDNASLGVLDGAVYVPGFGSSAEQTFTLGALRATGVLTLTGQPLNNETVVMDGKTYTFQTSLTDTDGNVLIGATASDSLDNLIAAIGLWDGAGTLYAASTVIHPSIYALAGTGDIMDVTAKAPGTAGNSLATTEGLTNGSWGGGTLSGGTNGDTYIIFPNVYRSSFHHFYAMQEV